MVIVINRLNVVFPVTTNLPAIVTFAEKLTLPAIDCAELVVLLRKFVLTYVLAAAYAFVANLAFALEICSLSAINVRSAVLVPVRFVFRLPIARFVLAKRAFAVDLVSYVATALATCRRSDISVRSAVLVDVKLFLTFVIA